jgi:hypothetical protein
MAWGFRNLLYFRTAAYHRAGQLNLGVPNMRTYQLPTRNSEGPFLITNTSDVDGVLAESVPKRTLGSTFGLLKSLEIG